MKPDWQRRVAAHKIGEHALRFSDDLDLREALEDFLPQNAQLHFPETVTHAAVNTETEG